MLCYIFYLFKKSLATNISQKNRLMNASNYISLVTTTSRIFKQNLFYYSFIVFIIAKNIFKKFKNYDFLQHRA